MEQNFNRKSEFRYLDTWTDKSSNKYKAGGQQSTNFQDFTSRTRGSPVCLRQTMQHYDDQELQHVEQQMLLLQNHFSFLFLFFYPCSNPLCPPSAASCSQVCARVSENTEKKVELCYSRMSNKDLQATWDLVAPFHTHTQSSTRVFVNLMMKYKEWHKSCQFNQYVTLLYMSLICCQQTAIQTLIFYQFKPETCGERF